MMSLEPERFRSPLLEPLPPVPEELGRGSRWRRRWLVALGPGAAAALVVSFKTGWLAVDGPGRLVYRLHDEIYLRLKGHLFTAFYPGSWIYFLSGLSLVALALIALVWRRPLTPAWQVAVARRLITWRAVRGVLSRSDRAWKSQRRRWRGRWQRVSKWPVIGRRWPRWPAWIEGTTLLDEVLEHEQAVSLDRLEACDPRSQEAARELSRLVELALFSTRLIDSAASGHDARPGSKPLPITAVVHLDQALLRLDLVRVLHADDEPPSIVRLRGRLEPRIRGLLDPVLENRLPEPDFSIGGLAADLVLVLGLRGRRAWPGQAEGEEEERRRRILAGVEVRRATLDRCRRELERWSAFGHRRARRPSLKELGAPRRFFEIRLAVDVALFAALRYGVSGSALAFLESLEGLRFALLMVGGTESSPADDDHEIEVVLRAVERLPAASDYRLVARLGAGGMDAGEELEAALERRSEVVTEGDLRLVAARRAELSTAGADTSG